LTYRSHGHLLQTPYRTRPIEMLATIPNIQQSPVRQWVLPPQQMKNDAPIKQIYSSEQSQPHLDNGVQVSHNSDPIEIFFPPSTLNKNDNLSHNCIRQSPILKSHSFRYSTSLR